MSYEVSPSVGESHIEIAASYSRTDEQRDRYKEHLQDIVTAHPNIDESHYLPLVHLRMEKEFYGDLKSLATERALSKWTSNSEPAEDELASLVQAELPNIEDEIIIYSAAMDLSQSEQLEGVE